MITNRMTVHQRLRSVNYNGRTLWIAEWHGYEWENYIIHEWPQGMRRLVVGGGGC